MNTATDPAAIRSFANLVALFVPRHVAAGLSFDAACDAAIAEAGAWAEKTRNDPARLAELVALAKR